MNESKASGGSGADSRSRRMCMREEICEGKQEQEKEQEEKEKEKRGGRSWSGMRNRYSGVCNWKPAG
jgi:hypothetical protein